MRMREWFEAGRRDNRGSALILVIVVIAFAGILGTSVLFYSTVNRSMKQVDEKSKENFYSTESGLDIFKANLQEYVEKKIAEEYTLQMAYYVPNDESSLRNKVALTIYAELCDNEELAKNDFDLLTAVHPVREEVRANSMLAGWFSPGESGLTTVKLLNTNSNPVSVEACVEENGGKQQIVLYLRNLAISYEENGYDTKLATDVRLSIGYTSPNVITEVKSEGKYLGYSLIAGGNIVQRWGDAGCVGNLYAGRDIVAWDGNFDVKADMMIAGGVIKSANASNLSVSAQTGYGELWADSIEMVAGGNTAGQSLTVVNVDCYVADDLSVDADDSKIIMAGGKYMGYGSNPHSDDENSAITINAYGASVNLSGVRELGIAGNNYLKVPQVYGAGTSSDVIKVLEGEAVGFRGSQFVYLVPLDCIDHNPMTRSLNAGEIDEMKALLLSRYGEYLDSGLPYRHQSVSYLQNGEVLHYYYLNFKNSSKAAEFFKNYGNTELLKKYASELRLGNVLLPGNSNIFTRGSVVRKNGSEISIDLPNQAFPGGNYARCFQGLLRGLDKNAAAGVADAEGNMPNIVRSIIREEQVENYKHSVSQPLMFDENYQLTTDPSKKVYVAVVDTGDFTISENMQGIFISLNGSITSTVHDVKGIVIAGGDIFLQGSKVENQREGVDFVEQLLEKNPQLQRYFRNYPLPKDIEGGAEEVTRNTDISFENWIKN